MRRLLFMGRGRRPHRASPGRTTPTRSAVEAIDLILRSLRGEATPFEQQRLLAWRERSLANEKTYRGVARIWELSGKVRGKGPETPPPSALELLNSKSVTRHGRGSRPVSSRRNPTWILAAATIVLTAGLGFHILWGGPEESASFAATEFVTGPGEMVTARLSDGTVVKLAPSSRLRARGTPRAREVWLDGRAFFAVAHDKSRPFTVRTRAGDALVLGTRFEVLLEGDSLRVVVVEGKVSLGADDGTVQVGAGQVARLAGGDSVAVEDVADLEPFTGWLGNLLVFQATPLSSVARDLERHYGVSVQIADPDLEEKTVTAWFNQASMREVVSVVCRVVVAHCSVQGSVVHIEP